MLSILTSLSLDYKAFDFFFNLHTKKCQIPQEKLDLSLKNLTPPPLSLKKNLGSAPENEQSIIDAKRIYIDCSLIT